MKDRMKNKTKAKSKKTHQKIEAGPLFGCSGLIAHEVVDDDLIFGDAETRQGGGEGLVHPH